METRQLPLLSPLEEVSADEHGEVMVSKNMAVEIGRVMARDDDNGMMASMQMDKAKKRLQQQPQQQQQQQLHGAAAPDPWPPPSSADSDESNSEREIGRHCFLVFVSGGRAVAGSYAFGKCKAKGGQSECEQDGSDWNREGIDNGWSLSIFGRWGHEMPARRLTRPWRVRVHEEILHATSFEIGKTRILFKYYSSSSITKTCL